MTSCGNWMNYETNRQITLLMHYQSWRPQENNSCLRSERREIVPFPLQRLDQPNQPATREYA
jgi:hypothetical protein